MEELLVVGDVEEEVAAREQLAGLVPLHGEELKFLVIDFFVAAPVEDPI